MNYEQLCSKLQSRLARRANTITSLTHWKLLYKAERNYGDMAKVKESLRELEDSQRLDKQLLKQFESFVGKTVLVVNPSWSDD